MSVRRVWPSVAEGRVRAPPSKSYTHRALIVAHLAGRTFSVRRPLYAADTLATRRGLARLGTRVSGGRTAWTLMPERSTARRGGRLRRIECGESGTTLRFLSAVAARENFPVQFDGAEALAVRPMAGLVEALRDAGAEVSVPARTSLPMTVRGPLRPGRIRVNGSVSSQYVSSLLLVLPTLPGDSVLTVTGVAVSRPYVDATRAILAAHGVSVSERAGRWRIPGGQSYSGRSFTVPGDASSAAYLWCAAAVTGGRVTVSDVPPRWPQADRRVLEALAAGGASVSVRGDAVSVDGRLHAGFDVDLTESPDLYPLLGAVAAVTPATSWLRGASHVVFKESNRQAATMELVRRAGGRARRTRAGLEVRGTSRPRPIVAGTSSDHRVVMSTAIAALASTAPSRLSDASAVVKSYPRFWSDLAALGISTEQRT